MVYNFLCGVNMRVLCRFDKLSFRSEIQLGFVIFVSLSEFKNWESKLSDDVHADIINSDKLDRLNTSLVKFRLLRGFKIGKFIICNNFGDFFLVMYKHFICDIFNFLKKCLT